jgi:MFS transporter, DHA1 family, multidrug resistance protein
MKHLKTTLVIGALSTLGPFSVDTYFPSFPALAAHFGVSEIQMQSTLSWYLVALAGMNLFHGTLLGAACHYGLPESLPAHLRHSFHPGNLLRGYRETLSHSAFLLSCLALAFGGGGFLLYVATAPDVVLNILHLSESQFGWMFVPIVLGLMLGSLWSARLAGRVEPRQQVRYGFLLMCFGAVINLAVNYWLAPRVPWAVLPLTVYTLGFSLIAPIVSLDGLDMFPHRKGLAASLQGFMHIVVFAGIAGWVAPLVYRSGLKHAVGLASFMALCWLGYYGYKARGTTATRAGAVADPERR